MMNYPVYLEDDFLDILVFMYVCLNVKHLKIVCTFHSEIYDSIHN